MPTPSKSPPLPKFRFLWDVTCERCRVHLPATKSKYWIDPEEPRSPRIVCRSCYLELEAGPPPKREDT